MAEVVEAHTRQSTPLPDALESKPDGIGRQIKHQPVLTFRGLPQASQDAFRRVCHWYLPWITGLGFLEAYLMVFEVDATPLQRQQLPPPHACLKSKDD